VSTVSRAASAFIAASLLLQSFAVRADARPQSGRPFLQFRPSLRVPAMQRIPLLGGKTATVSRDGIVTVFDKTGRLEQTQIVPRTLVPLHARNSAEFPGEAEAFKSYLDRAMKRTSARPYAPHALLVVLRDGISPSSDHVKLPQITLRAILHAKTAMQLRSASPAYTNDS